MFFTECDKYELSLIGWTPNQLNAIKKHVDELYSNHRNDYSYVDNFRFARLANKDEEIGYRFSVENRNKKATNVSYDKTLSCGSNGEKVMYGFDGFLISQRQETKNPYKK